MKAQTIPTATVSWRPELIYNHKLNLNINELHPKVTIVIAHAQDEIKGCSLAIEKLAREGVELRLLYVTGTKNQFHFEDQLAGIEAAANTEIICLDYPAKNLDGYELELARFLISFCDDTSIFLAPGEGVGDRDHESCASAAMVAACRLNAEFIGYQIDSEVSSLAMKRFDRQIHQLKNQKKEYISQNMLM